MSEPEFVVKDVDALGEILFEVWDSREESGVGSGSTSAHDEAQDILLTGRVMSVDTLGKHLVAKSGWRDLTSLVEDEMFMETLSRAPGVIDCLAGECVHSSSSGCLARILKIVRFRSRIHSAGDET